MKSKRIKEKKKIHTCIYVIGILWKQNLRTLLNHCQSLITYQNIMITYQKQGISN